MKVDGFFARTVLLCALFVDGGCFHPSASPKDDYTPPTSGSLVDVVVQGPYAFVLEENFGVRVLDISKPDHVLEVGAYQSPGGRAYGGRLRLAESLLYVSTSEQCLGIVDVSDPRSPVLLGEHRATSCFGTDLFLDGTTAYVAAKYDGLYAFDVSNPAMPAILSRWEAGLIDDVTSVAVVNHIAYVGTDTDGLRLVDFADPRAPVSIGAGLNVGGTAKAIALQGPRAYIATDLHGLRIIDVQNATAPRIVADVGGFSASSVLVAANGGVWYADSGSLDAALHELDLTNPSRPTDKHTFKLSSVEGFAIVGPRAYVARRSGLAIFDINQ